MDQAAVLLGALRAKARLGAARLSAAEVEALADAAGIDAAALPALVTRLAEANAVRLVWGGGVEVLPEPEAPAGSVVIDARGAQFGAGATLGGHGTTGATITLSAGITAGELAAVLHELRAVQAGLTGDTAESAKAAEAALRDRPPPDAPDDEKRGWAKRVMDALTTLLSRAPQVKAVVDLAEKALKPFLAA
ncbi:hypothetical protein [Elioraea sp.]|uniref:hypothetical protein n=1 Tax=Elioraea sp. TaxID=2185103 RepID=UPI003F708670